MGPRMKHDQHIDNNQATVDSVLRQSIVCIPANLMPVRISRNRDGVNAQQARVSQNPIPTAGGENPKNAKRNEGTPCATVFTAANAAISLGDDFGAVL